MSGSEVATVLAWHEALNAGDVERLVALSSDDIEVGGPRGAGRGVELLREWVGRADIELEPGRVYQRGERVVVEEQARWRTAERGELSEPQMAASVFVVRERRVVSVVRHPDLAGALEVAGMKESDRSVEGG